MSDKYYTTPAFKALQAEWYDRLKQDGFEDLEVGSPGERENGRLATDVRKDEGSVLATKGEEVAEYYRQASSFLHSHSFETQQDYRIWELHADGHSQHTISRRLGISERMAWKSTSASRADMQNASKGGRPATIGVYRQGVAVLVRLTDPCVLALDHVMAHLGVSAPEAFRRSLIEYATALQR